MVKPVPLFIFRIPMLFQLCPPPADLLALVWLCYAFAISGALSIFAGGNERAPVVKSGVGGWDAATVITLLACPANNYGLFVDRTRENLSVAAAKA